MIDPQPDAPASLRAGTWRLALLGAVGAIAPPGLALFGLARPEPALLAAAAIAALAVFAAWRRPDDIAPLAASGHGQTFAREPPFADMLEHMSDPILLIEGGRRDDLSDRRFVFANAAARALLRIQRQEGPLATAMRAPQVLEAVDEALFGSAPGDAVYESRGVQERFWRARALPLADAAGAGGRFALLCLRDETEIRRGERTRADFLANASHELRTPLASLAGFIETLRGHARDDAAARETFLGIMHVQAERMRRLIDDLMSLSRIELGEHIPPSGRVDVAQAVIDVLDALAPMAAERCVTFDQRLPGAGAAMAAADRDQILQVIQNLAENAVKYTPPGGRVTVEVLGDLRATEAAAPAEPPAAHLSLLTPEHADGRLYAAVRVRDRGPGIARAQLPRLTERFYRVEGQKNRERPGTGLGLAIVKHIVNRHRGGLVVESAEGVGAMFTAYVPMAESPPA